MKLHPTLLISFLFLTSLVVAQEKMPVQGSSEVLVHGTSTLHDWTMNCEQFNGSVVLTESEGVLTDMSDLQFTIVVKGMKSGKSAMDNNTYKAMSEPNHPNVQFESSSIDIQSKGEGYAVKAKGKLTIAGSTREVTLEATGRRSGERWVFSGKKDIHTPDYGVERVSAMMGTIKTGEDVVIDFDIVF